MIEPTERVLWLLVVVALVGLLGMAMPLVGAAAPGLMVALVLAVVVDAVRARSASDVRVARKLPPFVVQGHPAELAHAIESPRACVVEVTDTVPATARPTSLSRDVEHTLSLADREIATVRTQLVLRGRGVHVLGRVAVRTRGPWGLVKRRARLTVHDELRVLPDLARIAAQADRLLRGAHDGGAPRKRRMHEGRELDSLRDYVAGDDPRLVEHKRSARTGTLVVRKLRPEQHQDVLILIDAGRQLFGVDEHGEPRVDGAVTVALTLASAALTRGDRVGLGSFSIDVDRFCAPQGKAAQLRALAESVVGVTAAPVESDPIVAVRHVLRVQRRRALVVLVTDVTDEPQARALTAAVRLLRGRHVPLVLAVGDPGLGRIARGAQAAGSASPDDEDALASVAALRLLEHRRRALAAVRAAGAAVVDAQGAAAPGAAVDAYANLKGQGRIG